MPLVPHLQAFPCPFRLLGARAEKRLILAGSVFSCRGACTPVYPIRWCSVIWLDAHVWSGDLLKRGSQPDLSNLAIAPWLLPQFKEFGVLFQLRRKLLVAEDLFKARVELPQSCTQRRKQHPFRITRLPGNTVRLGEQPG